MSNENDKQSKGPSHIAYQVREGGEGQKSYFNRIGSVWPHKDGEGFNIQLDSVPVDGRITVRSVQDRLQEMKDKSEGRGENDRDDKRSSGREDRRSRDTGPRYER